MSEQHLQYEDVSAVQVWCWLLFLQRAALENGNGNCVLSGQEKMQDIYWLLRVCIRTIEHGDRTGSLFSFMPEFYLSVAMNSYSALKNYFSPVNSMEELPGEGVGTAS